MALAAATAAAPSTNITSFHLILRRHRLLLLVLILHMFCLGVKTHNGTEQHDQVTDSIGQARIIQPITGGFFFFQTGTHAQQFPPPIVLHHQSIFSTEQLSQQGREKSLFSVNPRHPPVLFPVRLLLGNWGTIDRDATNRSRSLPFLVPSARLRTFLRTLTQEGEEEGSDAAACCVGRILEGREGKLNGLKERSEKFLN